MLFVRENIPQKENTKQNYKERTEKEGLEECVYEGRTENGIKWNGIKDITRLERGGEKNMK